MKHLQVPMKHLPSSRDQRFEIQKYSLQQWLKIPFPDTPWNNGWELLLQRPLLAFSHADFSNSVTFCRWSPRNGPGCVFQQTGHRPKWLPIPLRTAGNITLCPRFRLGNWSGEFGLFAPSCISQLVSRWPGLHFVLRHITIEPHFPRNRDKFPGMWSMESIKIRRRFPRNRKI